MDQTPATPISGPLRWAFSALLLAALVAMFWGNAEHRTDLQVGGLAALLVLLGWFAIYRKQRAVRDPDFAAKMKKIDASPGVAVGLRRRLLALKLLVPMLLLSLPIWYWLHTIQPDTPMLRDWRSADIQRLALAGGLILTLIGYCLRWLLRRGDSGAG
jgi:hypothetical protein